MHLFINKNKDDQDSNRDTSTVATLERPKTKKPPLYRIILLNDDYTPMEFVVYILQVFFDSMGIKLSKLCWLFIHMEREFVVSLLGKSRKQKALK